MNDFKDILAGNGMRQRPFTVPDGYFDKLETRLQDITSTTPVSMWTKVRPALAIAASFAAILLVGGLILNKTVSPTEEMSIYEQYAYADLIPVTDPLAIYVPQQETSIDKEDIITYLLESHSDPIDAIQ